MLVYYAKKAKLDRVMDFRREDSAINKCYLDKFKILTQIKKKASKLCYKIILTADFIFISYLFSILHPISPKMGKKRCFPNLLNTLKGV